MKMMQWVPLVSFATSLKSFLWVGHREVLASGQLNIVRSDYDMLTTGRFSQWRWYLAARQHPKEIKKEEMLTKDEERRRV